MSSVPLTRIVAKDLRRFWPLIAAVWLLTALAAFVPFHPDINLDEPHPSEIMDLVRVALVAFVGLAAALEDSARSDRADWVVRPVGRGVLVGAKLLLLCVSLALPAALAGAGGALALGSGVRGIAGTALAATGPILLAALAAGVLGALTGSYLRALIVGAAIAVAGVFLYVLLVGALVKLAPRSLGFGQFPPEMDFDLERGILLWGAVGTLALGLAFQYFQRRAVRSFLLVLVLLGAVTLSSEGWLNWKNRPHPPISRPAPVRVEPLDRHLSVHRVNFFPWFLFLPDLIEVSLPVSQGPGPDVFLQTGQSRFTAGDGRTFLDPEPFAMVINEDSSGLDSNGPPLLLPPEKQLLAFGWPEAPRRGKTYSATVLLLPRPDYERLRGARGHLETWAEFQGYHLQVVGRIPLAPGATFAKPGARLRVRSIFVLPNGDVNMTVETVCIQHLHGPSIGGAAYALVNSRRNEVAIPLPQSVSRGENPLLGVSGHIEMISFHPTWNLSTHKAGGVLDEAWVRDAELATENRPPLLYPPTRTLIDWGEVILPDTPAKD